MFHFAIGEFVYATCNITRGTRLLETLTEAPFDQIHVPQGACGVVQTTAIYYGPNNLKVEYYVVRFYSDLIHLQTDFVLAEHHLSHELIVPKPARFGAGFIVKER